MIRCFPSALERTVIQVTTVLSALFGLDARTPWISLIDALCCDYIRKDLIVMVRMELGRYRCTTLSLAAQAVAS